MAIGMHTGQQQLYLAVMPVICEHFVVLLFCLRPFVCSHVCGRVLCKPNTAYKLCNIVAGSHSKSESIPANYSIEVVLEVGQSTVEHRQPKYRFEISEIEPLSRDHP